MSEKEYPLEQLVWLAGRLRKGIQASRSGKADRAQVILDFAARFPESAGISPGKLVVIYRGSGGTQATFITKYDRPEDEKEAKLGAVIKDALLAWDPREASFATAWALAAKLVNERFGEKYKATQIEAIVQKAGGVLSFLFDCNVNEREAQRAAELVKQPRTTKW